VPRSYAIPPEEKSEQAIPVSPEGHIRGRAIPEQPEPEGIRGRLTEPTDDEKPGPDEAFRYKG
jgi:hypothetical protein